MGGMSSGNNVGLNSQLNGANSLLYAVNTQVVADARTSTPTQPAPNPTVPAGVTGQPVATNQTAAQAEKTMNDGVDAELNRLLGNKFSPPKSHFDRVKLVADALKTITDPAQRQAFVATIGKLGAPFGINFGLRELGSDGAWGQPLNADAFKGVDVANNSQAKPYIDIRQNYVDDWNSKGTKPATGASAGAPDATTGANPGANPQALSPEDTQALSQLVSQLPQLGKQVGDKWTKEQFASLVGQASPNVQQLLGRAWEAAPKAGDGTVNTADLIASIKQQAQQPSQAQPAAQPTPGQPTAWAPTNPNFNKLSTEQQAIARPILEAAKSLADKKGPLSPAIIQEAVASKEPAYQNLNLLVPHLSTLFPQNAQRSYADFETAFIEWVGRARTTSAQPLSA
jgi:hypothetical protein